ncbi:MAG: hypothetical protein K2H60_12970 [Muribaculaceae bacterium]|nr:hypothetical protein [Muribaculaceae bacterium]
MNNTRFTTRACDEMGYYVYCLVDPRDNKVFYVGKGKGDRGFAHIHNAVEEPDENEKNRRINEIGVDNVRHFVIRHGLSEKEAFTFESSLIDFLMDDRVNGGKNNLTNLIHGHHHRDKGIMTVHDINAKYPEKEFIPKEEDKIIIVLLNNSFKDWDHIYERARGDWAFREGKVKECTHVLAVHHGIVRAVYPVTPESWEMTRDREYRKSPRWRFSAEKDDSSPYLYARIYNDENDEIIDKNGNKKSKRKKVDFNGKTINPRKGAWSVNY